MTDRKILLDTETTGFYPKQGDKIVEIAALELFDDKDLGASFHFYLNPQREIPYDSIKIHGITNEKVVDCPTFKDIAKQFLDFIGDSKIIAHNASFDRDFINAELHNAGFSMIDPSYYIDTLAMARKKFNSNRNNSLDDLCKKFNISLESRKDFHGAMIDIELLSQVYMNLISGQNNIFKEEDSGLMMAGKNSSFTINNKLNQVIYSVKDFPTRSFPINSTEEKNHMDFIQNIKNSIWNK